MYDVIIVGGGPAGLSAALVLGRCRRKVLVCDNGKPRNAWAKEMHGFLTRDCMPPGELLAIGREQLQPYGVEWKNTEIVKAVCQEGGFELTSVDGELLRCRKLLIATGLKDYWPEIPGAEPFYGKSIHHCPYCDGWEARDKPLVAYGIGKVGIGLAMSLKTWSPDVTLCTDGSNRLSVEDKIKLSKNEIKWRPEKISKVKGTGEQLEFIVFDNHDVIPCHAIFFVMAAVQHSELPRQMNCDFTTKGVAKADTKQKTKTPGVYIAGDAARDMQQVVIAAAEGAKAAISINKELQFEEYK